MSSSLAAYATSLAQIARQRQQAANENVQHQQHSADQSACKPLSVAQVLHSHMKLHAELLLQLTELQQQQTVNRSGNQDDTAQAHRLQAALQQCAASLRSLLQQLSVKQRHDPTSNSRTKADDDATRQMMVAAPPVDQLVKEVVASSCGQLRSNPPAETCALLARNATQTNKNRPSAVTSAQHEQMLQSLPKSCHESVVDLTLDPQSGQSGSVQLLGGRPDHAAASLRLKAPMPHLSFSTAPDQAPATSHTAISAGQPIVAQDDDAIWNSPAFLQQVNSIEQQQINRQRANQTQQQQQHQAPLQPPQSQHQQASHSRHPPLHPNAINPVKRSLQSMQQQQQQQQQQQHHLQTPTLSSNNSNMTGLDRSPLGYARPWDKSGSLEGNSNKRFKSATQRQVESEAFASLYECDNAPHSGSANFTNNSAASFASANSNKENIAATEAPTNAFKSASDLLAEQQAKLGRSMGCKPAGLSRSRPVLKPPPTSGSNGIASSDAPPMVKRAFGASGGSGGGQASGANAKAPLKLKFEYDENDPPPALVGLDPKLIESISNDLLQSAPSVPFSSIVGLEFAKKCVMEIVVWPMKRPDLFKGLRAPPKGLLLFGPPGTGKTMIGKAIATESGSAFFNISASSLTSKWHGEGEKLVRTLFAVALHLQPSVIFIDEIDSMLTQRSDGEFEGSRRLKTEFLVQLDGCGTDKASRILVVGATNRPRELDEAARRRLVKKLYIPLPEAAARRALIVHLTTGSGNHSSLSEEDLDRVAQMTAGYSGADVTSLCQEAALEGIRDLHLSDAGIESIDSSTMRPIQFSDFESALKQVRPSVQQSDLVDYVAWDKQFGSFGQTSATLT